VDDLTCERWLWIPGYEGRYEISDLGRCRSHLPWRGTSSRILKPGRQPMGYGQVHLVAADGTHKPWHIHQLVMLAFVGPPPPGQEVRHLDGNGARSVLSNLAYGPHAVNLADRWIHGTLSLKEVCDNGHEYTDANTHSYLLKSGPSAGTMRRYCKACRLDRGRKYDAANRKRHPFVMACTVCGTDFTARTISAKYCSGACGQKAYKQRKAAGQLRSVTLDAIDQGHHDRAVPGAVADVDGVGNRLKGI
jgi:hypothetical protein